MRSAVALVALVAVAFGLTYADYAPLIPVVRAEFALDDLGAGLLSTALFTSYLVVTIATAGLVDRIAPKPLVAIGLAVAALGTALFAWSPAYAVAVLGKVLQGAGSAVSFVAATRYVAGLYGPRRSHFALGLYGGGFPLGSALALLAMPTLGTMLGTWRGAFWLETSVIATVLLLWLAAPPVGPVRTPGGMRDALRCRNCWWTFVQHAAGFGLALSSGTWITVYLLREFGLPLALSGILGSLLLVVAVVARPLGGLLLLREHVATRTVMRQGSVAILVGVGLLAVPGRPLALALLGATLVGVGVGLPYAAVFNTAAASLPRAPGAAQGLAAVGGTTGVMLGAPAMGYAVQTYGFWAAWLFVGAVAALALGGTFLMRGEEDMPGGGPGTAGPGREATPADPRT